MGYPVTLQKAVVDELSGDISLFWGWSDAPRDTDMVGSGPNVVIDPRRIPNLLGYFEPDELGKDEIALVLYHNQGHQAPPSAIVGIYPADHPVGEGVR